MKYICTWMYCVNKGQKILHNQTGYDSDTDEVQNIYWRCVFVMFSSYRRLNTHNKCLLFINKSPPDYIDNVSTKDLIKNLNIELVYLKEFHLPPEGFSKSWGTQFIIIDIINKIKEIVSSNDEVIVLDSDCIFIKDIDSSITEKVKYEKCLTYTMKFKKNEKINYLTLEEIKEVCKTIKIHNYESYMYCGGEFFYCIGSELNTISNLLEKIWSDNLELFRNNKKYLREEAHLLSAVYTNNNYKHYTANGIIRRIWTDKLRFHDYNIKDKSLYICHFPSEKKHGFKSLWSILFIQNKPWPSTNDIFKIMNCHHSFSDISKIIIRLAHRTKLKIYEYIQ